MRQLQSSHLDTRIDENNVGWEYLLRIQTIVLLAKDMGDQIAFDVWKNNLIESGLMGRWSPGSDYSEFDPIELCLALLNGPLEQYLPTLRIPNDMHFALQLAVSGKGALPARCLKTIVVAPPGIKKELTRNAQHAGAISLQWTTEHLGRKESELRHLLEGMGYYPLEQDWYVPAQPFTARIISENKDAVFHRALWKMLYYCGPLTADDICSGLRAAISRTNYPVAPPHIMEKILLFYGYKQKEGLFYFDWNDSQPSPSLSRSEEIILSCLRKFGRVVHHSELALEFYRSNLTLPSLHRTLNTSPLFVKVDQAMYKLRGQSVNYEDIARAKAVERRTGAGPEVIYSPSGVISIIVTLSPIALSSGRLISTEFPNLTGSWKCIVKDELLGTLDCSEHEFRQLRRAFQRLQAKPGDRLKLDFNTWDRTVRIEKDA
ncbi:MAG: hypothetical protein QXZ17_10010 [Nitrososphaerota archaeon]